MKDWLFSFLLGMGLGRLIYGWYGISPIRWSWDSWVVVIGLSAFIAGVWIYDNRDEL